MLGRLNGSGCKKSRRIWALGALSAFHSKSCSPKAQNSATLGGWRVRRLPPDLKKDMELSSRNRSIRDSHEDRDQNSLDGRVGCNSYDRVDFMPRRRSSEG